MNRLLRGILFALLVLVPTSTRAQDLPIDIPYEKFVLDNGLTVIVHEDRKAPIVAVNIWYHVGSKNEKAGKTGFAHLFEHLMFNGSENFDDDYFQVMERIGATDLNGTTNEDRTNYFQNVPTSALDLAMWMESDRMGHLVGAITQEKLDEQRGVVQNEKREGDNAPYGLVDYLLTENSFPKGHPYSWDVIGSMEDLDAASLDDVKEWFSTYYGPSNAVLVLAGDIDVATARAKAEQYFGDIAPGPPVARHDAYVAKMTGEHRMQMEDRVPQARIYMRWNFPQWASREYALLDLVSDVLTSGKTSRLYKRLVYDEQLATSVSAFVDGREIASQFGIVADARPGVELAAVEAVIREELARLLAEGPTQAELDRVRSAVVNGLVRGTERIGGFGGKSDILAQAEVYGGSPDAWKRRVRVVQSATTTDLRDAALAWLSDGVLVVEVNPFAEYAAAATGADRSALPGTGTPPSASFPVLQRATLSNGLKIVLAERPTAPIVEFNLMVDAGYAADQAGIPGTAQLAMGMLDEGTTSRDALEISEEATLLGAGIGAGSDLDMSFVSLSALKANLQKSMDLYADIVLNPSFPETDFQRLQRQQLVGIQREKVTPIQMALRVFPGLLYGENHAYSLPLTGSGTETTVQQITTKTLAEFHQAWFRPNNATLVVAGDITMAELQPLVERGFGSWKRAQVPAKNVGDVTLKPGGTVYVMDRPGSPQSIIFAGHLAPRKAQSDELALTMANAVLGGAFVSRVNLNLREEKGWAYGAFTVLWDAQAQRPYFAYAPVQADKTAESMVEIRNEFEGFVGSEPVTEDELAFTRDQQILTLPGQWETISAVGGSVSNIVEYGLPDDYYQGYAGRLAAMDLVRINTAAKALVKPSNVMYLVVGDRAAIEPRMRELGFTDIRALDADGKPVSSN